MSTWRAEERAERLAAKHAQRRKEVIAQLRAFHAAHGRVPTAREMGTGTRGAVRHPDAPSHSTLDALFGSSAAAMRTAGFTPRTTGQRKEVQTRVTIIRRIQAEVARYGRVPTMREAPAGLLKAAARIFGSWHEAVTRAGFVPRRSGRTRGGIL